MHVLTLLNEVVQILLGDLVHKNQLKVSVWLTLYIIPVLLLSFDFVHHDLLLDEHHVSHQIYLLFVHSILLKNSLLQLGKSILLCFQFEQYRTALTIDNLSFQLRYLLNK